MSYSTPRHNILRCLSLSTPQTYKTIPADTQHGTFQPYATALVVSVSLYTRCQIPMKNNIERKEISRRWFLEKPLALWWCSIKSSGISGFGIHSIPKLYGCGGRTRTYDIQLMGLTSFHLLYSAIYGGGCGIWTHGWFNPSTVFKTASISLSDNPPLSNKRGPVSPGCQAAASASASSSVNERLPHPRIPLRLDGTSWASSMGAWYWAGISLPAGGHALKSSTNTTQF